MAKAFEDCGEWCRNKLGQWLWGKMNHSRVHSSTPPPDVDDEVIEDIVDPTGSRPMHETRGKDYTNDDMTTFEMPGEFIAGQGEVTCTLADTAYPLTATPTPCIKVFVWNANSGTAVWGDDTLTTDGGLVPKAADGVDGKIPIKDAALVHVASGTALDKIKWVAIGRRDIH